MGKLTLEDLDLKNARVLMRVDFNVPFDEKGNITDDSRITSALASIEYVLDKGASLVLMSHLGRPKGFDPKLSLKPVALHLSKLLKKDVLFANDCTSAETEKKAKALKPKEVLLLENLRFHEAEESPEKDPSFAENLAKLGTVYVNDAFGAAHRKHASTYFITKYFKTCSAMGFLMKKEVDFLDLTIKHPKRPFFAILGGAKISTKIKVLDALLTKVDALFIGGGMAYTFLKALGKTIGNSIFDPSMLSTAKRILLHAEEKSIPIYLPEDHVLTEKLENNSKTSIISTEDDFPSSFIGVDIGPKTLHTWEPIVKKASTIFWNGPMGVFEMPNFSKGTLGLTKILKETNAVKIVGGGDSVAAIHSLHAEAFFTHLSSGGGASLELIEQGSLPGIEALTNK